jgi:gentisate 1,2-dioxygenase
VFFEPYAELRQPQEGPHNRSEAEYRDAEGKTVAGQVTEALDPAHSPLLVYRWTDTDAELERLASASDEPMVSLEFTNPRSGASVLPTLSCGMHRIKPSRSTLPHQRSGNVVYVVYRGSGTSVIAGQRFSWEAGDMFVVPSWAPVEHHGDTSADLFSLSDTPVLRALGIYREQTLDHPQNVVDTFLS